MIEPPKWAPDAIPTKEGWTRPGSTEVVLTRTFTQKQIDEYMKAKEWQQPAAPEVVIEPIPAIVEEVVVESPEPEEKPKATRTPRKKVAETPIEEPKEEPRGFWPFPSRRP